MAQPLHADVTIRIGTVLVELAPHRIISTVGYNGSVPAPVIRLREGRPVNVELINETDTPELVHWHGQFLPSEIDGAAEEKSRFVPAHGVIRYTLVPRPAGTRWVHTHVGARADLHRSTYTGQFGFVLVEPANDPGRYDREVFLATHEWEPFLGAEEEEEEDGRKKDQAEEQEEKENGLEIGYRLFSINGKALGHGEPIRVKSGERVLFRILNASATENIQLALPGHEFEVVAMDGNPVPTPRKVRMLSLGVAERIDAIVEMNQPGVWILGTPMDDDRQRGMGIVVEYAGESGTPKWMAPPRERWDYTLFGGSAPVPKPDEVIPMVIRKIPGGHNGFNHWTINGLTYDQSTPLPIHEGRRYRLAFHNQSDDLHPLHLHRHSFEMVNVGAKSSSGIMKDVVMIRPDERIEVDFVADNPGLTLFHCHQQLHMDYGFMRLFKYV
ncbi:MAG: multicopper oxidase domain-containing protein [Acidobacteriia bacterium]|nr:multicopper oxidase domain-containing protein [Terriglobia bacterium]